MVGPWRSEETAHQLVASNWIVQNFSNGKCFVPCGVIAKEMVSLVGRRRTRDDDDDDESSSRHGMLGAKKKKGNKHIQRKLSDQQPRHGFFSMEPREEVNPRPSPVTNTSPKQRRAIEQSPTIELTRSAGRAGQTEIERHGSGLSGYLVWCCILVLYVSCKVYQICNRTRNTFWTLSSNYHPDYFILQGYRPYLLIPIRSCLQLSRMNLLVPIVWVESFNSVIKLSDLPKTL